MNKLHEQALQHIPRHFIAYADVKPGIEQDTGYKQPFNILTDLAQWGYLEHRTEQLVGPGNAPRGWRNYFRRTA